MRQGRIFYRPCFPIQKEPGAYKRQAQESFALPIDLLTLIFGAEVFGMLRSIKKTFDMVKQNDPETAITVHTIRMWCKEGKIKYLTAGNKILVDVESLMDYISLKG